MRASVINRFTKIVPLAAVAALTTGLTVIPASTAWACGDASAPATSETNEPDHGSHPGVAFLNDPKATSITAGGPKVEIGVQIANFTGAPYKAIAPSIGLYNPQSSDSGEDLKTVNLRIEDLTVEALKDGAWKSLKVHHGCDPALRVDTSVLNAPLADGRAQRYVFRIGLSAKAPKEQKSFDVYLGTNRGASPAPAKSTLKINRLAPKPTTAAPKATPAAAPAAATSTPTAAATPSQQPTATAASATELAETGPRTPNTFLLASAAAFVVLGTAVLVGVRRLARR